MVEKTIKGAGAARTKRERFRERLDLCRGHIKKKKAPIKRKNVVFLSLKDFASVSTRLAEAINKYTDWNARCISRKENPFGYPNDLLEVEENKKEIRKVLKQSDVIIWGSSSFGYFPFDIRPNRNIYYGLWHGGSDYRKSYRDFNKIHPELDFVFSHRDLVGLDKGNIKLQAPYNCEDYEVPKRKWGGTLKIGHSPSKRGIKGTKHFLNGMKKLKKGGFPIEVVLLENMTTEEVVEAKRDLHIFFDQIGGYEVPLGDGANYGYGMSLVESASYGTICLAWSDYPDTPIIMVRDDEDIYRRVSKLLNNRKQLPKLSKKTREWVVKEHGYENISKYFIKIIEDRI